MIENINCTVNNDQIILGDVINGIVLNDNYSTTRLLTKEKPEIINNPEDKFKLVLLIPEGEKRRGEGGLRTKGYFKKSYEDKPLISIVTVVYNGEKYLEETIQSVINQTYDNVEYIIIDGGSTDGTVDIVKKYEDKIDYWISEKDKGIYDAMNKGILVSTGKYLIFMNAGDYFIDDMVINSDFFIDADDVVFGNVKYESGKTFVSEINNKIYLKNTIHHQGIFYSIDCFKKYGLFDLKYKILADYDFNLKLFQQNVRFKKIDNFIALCSDFGVSDTPNLKNYIEESDIRKKYIKPKLLAYVLYSYSIAKFIIKKIKRSIV